MSELHTEEELKLISGMIQTANSANKLGQVIAAFAGDIRDGYSTEAAIKGALETHVHTNDVALSPEMFDALLSRIVLTARTHCTTGQLRQRLQEDLLYILKTLE